MIDAPKPTAYTNGDEVVLAKHWTGDEPPKGWTALYSETASLALTRRLIELTEEMRAARLTKEQPNG